MIIFIATVSIIIGFAPLIWAIDSWHFNKKYRKKNHIEADKAESED